MLPLLGVVAPPRGADEVGGVEGCGDAQMKIMVMDLWAYGPRLPITPACPPADRRGGQGAATTLAARLAAPRRVRGPGLQPGVLWSLHGRPRRGRLQRG